MQPWQSLESWLVMLQTNSGKLARIEFLVVFTAIILLLTFILDSYRYRTRSKFVRYVLIFLDTVADSIATYTLGLMQVVPFENELFQVWAVLLITLKDSTRYISGYSLHEKENRRRKEIRDLLDSFFLANLTATRGSRFKVPLWLLWGLNQLKIFHSIMAFDMAERSYAHGRNTRLVAGYMQYEHKLSELTEADERSVMSGFRYLVHGEAKQKVVPRLPHYQMELRTIQEEKLINIDKVWQCQGRLLNNSSRKKSHQESIVEGRKDICLSFALYKLLRRRFEGLDDYLCDEEREKSKKMISQLLREEKNAERLFRIIRKELAFVNDYLYTRFPVVFATGIPYVYLLYFVISGVGCWLAAELLIGYKPTKSELNHVKHGYNIDVIITFVVIILIRVKEFWEMATYLFSDWNKVLMLCTYVERASWQKSRVAEKLLGFLCNHTLITH